MSLSIRVEILQNPMVGQQRQQISEPQFAHSLLWINEMEMVDSLEEFKSSRSAAGKKFANFEMLDAKIASALNRII